MAELQRGHSGALADLFDRYHRLVFRIALRILRDHGEAEDLMQSVFLEIFQSAAQYDESKGVAKAWILQYAYHRSFNRREYLTLRGFYEHPAELLPSQELLAKAYAESLEGLEPIRVALGRLGKAERDILVLSFYEGFTMREIAQKTGRSFASVRHHYYRGLEKLRSILYERRDPALKPSAGKYVTHVQS
jgi:RNA polymerase sigma-70 factor (ECF subfamily)